MLRHVPDDPDGDSWHVCFERDGKPDHAPRKFKSKEEAEELILVLNECEREHEENKPFFEFMRKFNVSETGIINDAFGGTLFYAYREPPQQPTWRATSNTKRLIEDRFTEAEMPKVKEMLPDTRRLLTRRLVVKVKQAVEDLALESLYPIYQALGKKYKSWETKDLWHRKSKTVEKTLEDGFVVRRPVKENLPFLVNEEWPRERLEGALQDAENFFLKPSNVTLKRVAKLINKTWAPGEKLTDVSLQKLLERKGINWRERKREMVTRIKIRHEARKSRPLSEKPILGARNQKAIDVK